MVRFDQARSSGDDDVEVQPRLRVLPSSSHALNSTDVVFAELAQRTQRI